MAERDAWTKLIASDDPKAREAVVRTFQHWKTWPAFGTPMSVPNFPKPSGSNGKRSGLKLTTY
jgi:hypothetical protein